MSEPKLLSHKLLIILIFLFLSISIGFGWFVYQEFKNPPQETQTQASPEPKIIIPSPTPDPTADWKTFQNNDFSFEYPIDWIQELNVIKATDSGIIIYPVSKNETLMNECMKLDSTQNLNGLVIKKYSRVNQGEMCSTNDPNPREIWIVPQENAYAPGINFAYSVDDSLEAEQIFAQLLATFKFLQP